MKKAFPPLAYDSSQILILGTMPGEKSLQLQEYYGNRGNQFWKILFSVFGKEVSHDYEEKKQLLKDNKIAVWDVLAFCEREGSLDSNIRNEAPNDFAAFYSKHPAIRYVFFSSKNAAVYYDRYVGRTEGLVYWILPSPSGANATKTFAEKLSVWKDSLLDAIKT